MNSSVEAITRLNAEAGQTDEARGMFSSIIRVGSMTPKPDTKNSVMIWDMIMEKTNATSTTSDLNIAGLWRPSRCIRAASDSSATGTIASDAVRCVSSCNTVGFVVILVAVGVVIVGSEGRRDIEELRKSLMHLYSPADDSSLATRVTVAGDISGSSKDDVCNRLEALVSP